MIADLSSLGAPLPRDWHPMTVRHRQTQEVMRIKSTRYNPHLHEPVNGSGPGERIELTPNDPRVVIHESAPLNPSVPQSAGDSIVEGSDPAEPAGEIAVFVCDKCDKPCASPAGKAAHERACQVVRAESAPVAPNPQDNG